MRQQDILLLLLLPRSVQPITFVNCKQFKLRPPKLYFLRKRGLIPDQFVLFSIFFLYGE